ncbi:MAG: deoxyhypusine synthase [Candidatus Nealsonbacteria bacterium CG_4_10_14_0_2_um_filter_38_17]|uniref:Deoxyhypusine synthase n=2 Tax=Candidatus Nealsoniibacteriota TaxID=1817911 RepID=A0A2M7UXF5_9BACT|nr:MAG: deoxyhypusine synthase [Candidatus Nealsonbacteria bacterium CG23_combo_of_CG06-09_8_20_14_all_38_19]PIZ88649.1 MAG: deoxyhypusine synthase [Candidatus Nealsonbacteria bacterium CG_4_10_14_0_2_um_filter_38_17]
MDNNNPFLSGKKINPKKLEKELKVTDLVDNYFQAYNSARLNEACRLLAEKMLDPQKDVTIGITLAGALTPAGMSGMVASMMERGFIDFIIATGANLYHDTHFALNFPLHKGTWQIDDTDLYKHGVVRIYDIFLTTDTLLNTDKFTQKILLDEKAPRGAISSSEFHHYIGQRLLQEAPNPEVSILAQAAKYNIPVYTSSPGDSTYGMDLASFNKPLNKEFTREGEIDLHINPNLDVIETAAIVMGAKQNGAILLGGGSPKNFYMQTQPFLWECLGVEKGGHDYFIQITMDSPQWGGLSGATPQEAVSWGKINPDELKNTVVVYADVTLAVPILFAYAIEKAQTREKKNLYLKRKELVYNLEKEGAKKPVTWMAEDLYKKHQEQ